MNLISVIVLNIKNPTIISAGAVANEGIAVKIGASNIEIKNNAAVVIEVRPVLPPAATPADDSTNVVVVEVPSTAPAVVAIESCQQCGSDLRQPAILIKHICLSAYSYKSSERVKKIDKQE